MTEPLFRPEVVEARRRQWLGEISLAQPLALWGLSAFAALCALAVIAFLMVGEYTRRTRVPGQLVPDLGLVTVVAPVSGTVAGDVAREGGRIARGQPLAAVQIPAATVAGDVTDGMRLRLAARREAAVQEQSAADALLAERQAGISRQLASARKEREQVAVAIATQREQLELADAALARFLQLAKAQYVSQLELQRQELQALERKAALQALERDAIVVERDIARLRQSLREMPAQREAGAAEYKRTLALLGQEALRVEANGQVVVEAPVDGLVATRLVQPGQSVQAGQPLMSLLPAGASLQAHLMVPSGAIGFVEPGDEVMLRYQAFPHQKFGHQQGKVVRVSRSALAPGVSAGKGDPRADQYYRVVVELPRQTIMAYGQAEALRAGMTLEADILGDKRKLYEWVLEPLYSVTGRL